MHIPIGLLFLIAQVNGALPPCPGDGCPSGGLWSEWTVNGNPTCQMSCGACSKIFYTRHCLSQNGGCKCTGPTTKYVPCNTKACGYPSQKSCCIPYVSLIINGTMHCGPIPKETTTGSVPCCKSGGFWSEWTGFAYDASIEKWKKTRECVSTQAGCPCTGDDTMSQVQCPCKRTMLNANVCEDLYPHLKEDYVMFHHFELNINDAQGTAYLNLHAHNDQPPTYHCWTGVTGFPRTTSLILLVPGVEKNVPRCLVDRPFDCWGRTQEQKNMTVSFTCDPQSGYWRYDYLGVLVEGYNQPRFLKADQQ